MPTYMENGFIKVYEFPIRDSLIFYRKSMAVSWFDKEIQSFLLSWGVIFPMNSIPIRLLTYHGNINRVQFGTCDEDGIVFERPTEDNTMDVCAIDGLISALQIAKKEVENINGSL